MSMILNKQTGKQGFTLVELLVYIVLISVIVLIVGNMYKESVSFKVDTDRKLSTYANSSEVLNAMSLDLQKIGLKGELDSATGVNLVKSVYISEDEASGDRSSFMHASNGDFDSLYYRAAVLDATGKVEDIEHVEWVVIGKSLWRIHKLESSAVIDSVRIADHISKFKIDLGVIQGDRAESEVYYHLPDSIYFAPVSGSSLVTFDSANGTAIRGFDENLGEVYLAESNSSGATPFSYKMRPGVTYGVQLKMGFNKFIRDDYDINANLMALTLRKATGASFSSVTGIGDYLLYPSADYQTNERTYMISHGEATAVDAVPVLRFRLSADHRDEKARAYITELRIWEETSDVYEWYSEITDAEVALKARVKALRIKVEVTQGRETTPATKIIYIPNNGV